MTPAHILETLVGIPSPSKSEGAIADWITSLVQENGIAVQSDRRPLDAARGRPLTQGLAMLGVAFGLYDAAFWSGLREGLGRAMQGDGSVLHATLDGAAVDIPLSGSAKWQDGNGGKALAVQGTAGELANAGDFESDQPFSCGPHSKR